MGDWKIIEKHRDGLTDAAMTVASLGVYSLFGEKTYVYTIEHVDTGERKTVKASDEFSLGEIISEGDFEE